MFGRKKNKNSEEELKKSIVSEEEKCRGILAKRESDIDDMVRYYHGNEYSTDFGNIYEQAFKEICKHEKYMFQEYFLNNFGKERSPRIYDEDSYKDLMGDYCLDLPILSDYLLHPCDIVFKDHIDYLIDYRAGNDDEFVETVCASIIRVLFSFELAKRWYTIAKEYKEREEKDKKRAEENREAYLEQLNASEVE